MTKGALYKIKDYEFRLSDLPTGRQASARLAKVHIPAYRQDRRGRQ